MRRSAPFAGIAEHGPAEAAASAGRTDAIVLASCTLRGRACSNMHSNILLIAAAMALGRSPGVDEPKAGWCAQPRAEAAPPRRPRDLDPPEPCPHFFGCTRAWCVHGAST